MESSKFYEILLEFLQIGEKPETKEALLNLSNELRSINGNDEKRYKVIRLIQTFGVDEASAQDELTLRQWRRLRDVVSNITKVRSSYTPKLPLPSESEWKILSLPLATRTYKLDIQDFSEEIASVILNLVSALSSNVLSSAITVSVLEYFELVSALSEGQVQTRLMLEPIQKILESHGWTQGGFTSAPDRHLILQDLKALFSEGFDRDRKLPETPKMTHSQEPLKNELLIEVVKSLIDSIHSKDFEEAQTSFETLSDLIATEDEVPYHLGEVVKKQRGAPNWDLLLKVLSSYLE